jgi:hypothetical protein
MEDNKEFVEESTENVEAQTTEETEEAEETEVSEETFETEENEEPVEEEAEEVKEEAEKRYTDAELDEIIARKLSRQKRKLEREYKNKYSRLETVVNAGLGTSDIEEATNKLTEFYEENGVNIPSAPRYSEEDTRLLANAEAEEFIKNCTYKELVEEVDDLANIPKEQLTERDKIVFLKLADERKRREEESAVLELGITKDKLEAEDFKKFSSKLNSELPIKEKYELFLKLNPRKETKKIGSMKSGAQSKVKDFYTDDEIARLTEEELDNPEVWKAVRNSMTKGANTDNIF